MKLKKNFNRSLHHLVHCFLSRQPDRMTAHSARHDARHSSLLEHGDSDTNEKILVVFSDNTDLWWLKWLKRGFRHCFVVMRLGGQWVAIDPMAHHLQITVPQLPTDFDLKNWFCDQGLRVIESRPAPALMRCYPPIFLSCVELVKRILGLRKPLIVTPAQLYRYLNKYNRRPLWDH